MASTQGIALENTRPTANFPPSVWGSYFLKYASTITKLSENEAEQQYEGLKEEIERMLVCTENKLSHKLILIDAMDRLGVSYHFAKEIEDVLEKVVHEWDNENEGNDLHFVALRFLLLRQHGYNVSCDVFDKFKDDKGNFNEPLTLHIKGMLSLYEASYLGIKGETVFDQTLAFTISHLKSKVTDDLNSSLAKRVMSALGWPTHRCFPRQETRIFLSIYEEDKSHNKTLLKFAKLDFNKLQAMHQKELGNMTKWWKDLDFETKLPYARDRIVELYFWAMAMGFEPYYDFGRRALTKVLTLVSVLDDTFDAYGTYEEISLFMDAIERWDISAAEMLPEYMKVLYRAILDVYDEIEEETTKEGRPHCLHYAKEAMKELAQAYFAKAKWYHEGRVPTVEEYLASAATSSTYPALVTTALVGEHDLGTKDAFDWVFTDPPILRALSVMGRLLNDIVSHKFEQERGHAASVIECYTNEHSVTESQAYDWLRQEVEDSWKVINKGLIKPNPVAMPFLSRILNLARFTDFAYKEDDAYTLSSKNFRASITALLIDPLPV